MKKMKLGLPKGSLQEATFSLFRNAGIKIIPTDRSYFPVCDDDELDIRLIRAQEIPKYVEDGVLDAGITGYDWIIENNADVKEICELCYAKSGFRPVRWVLAVSKYSSFKKPEHLRGKRIATEVVNVTRRYFKKKRINTKIEFSWGATEAKVPELVDGIVELTETGSSLRANNLVILDEVLRSTTRFIINRKSEREGFKKRKTKNIALLLEGALRASTLVGLKMNVKVNNLKRLLKVLPALKDPTISTLTDKEWIAVEVIIEEKTVKKIIPDLKDAGAQGIIEYPLNKVIL